MYYSKKSGKRKEGLPKEERMSTAELAAYLCANSLAKSLTTCPICQSDKLQKYRFCKKCFLKGKLFRKEKLLELGRERHLKAKKEAAKLPAKNRKKAKIIESILKDQKIEEIRKKTILYKSIELKLLLKKLDEF